MNCGSLGAAPTRGTDRGVIPKQPDTGRGLHLRACDERAIAVSHADFDCVRENRGGFCKRPPLRRAREPIHPKHEIGPVAGIHVDDRMAWGRRCKWGNTNDNVLGACDFVTAAAEPLRRFAGDPGSEFEDRSPGAALAKEVFRGLDIRFRDIWARTLHGG
jgi:hypothetical protein